MAHLWTFVLLALDRKRREREGRAGTDAIWSSGFMLDVYSQEPSSRRARSPFSGLLNPLLVTANVQPCSALPVVLSECHAEVRGVSSRRRRQALESRREWSM